MIGIFFTSFVFIAAMPPLPPHANEPFVSGSIADTAISRFGVSFQVSAFDPKNGIWTVDLTYTDANGIRKSRTNQGGSSITIDVQEQMRTLTASQYLDFYLGFIEATKGLFCDLHRYLEDYRAPKRFFGIWRERVAFFEKSLLGGGQGLGLLLFFVATPASGISTSVASGVSSFLTQFAIGCLDRQVQAAFDERAIVDGKISTLLRTYDNPATLEVQKFYMRIIEGVLGYNDLNQYKRKLPLSCEYLQNLFPSLDSANSTRQGTSVVVAAQGPPAVPAMR